jgi:UTP--glucose-1-phosphate uridylyltransferase
MSHKNPDFAGIAERMQAEDLPQLVIDTFLYYYELLLSGSTGLISEAEISAVSDVPDMETLPGRLEEIGQKALSETVIIKLNGGLGTSMGLERAKSLLRVKEEYSFLDIIAHQAIGAGVPLLLMNSFSTAADSLRELEKYPALKRDLPLSFLQHKVPKIDRTDLSPANWEKDPELEWCPPGHGDIYSALVTRGTLDAMLSAGYQYAFVSNADNLGATLDKLLLGFFAQNSFPFMMEVADRTMMDKKGGHLARRQADGQFILREIAQCPESDLDTFQDVERHKFFNTNNLWINLVALKETMIDREYRLGLPMIRNRKTVDPRDSSSTPVYQLETAMGSAIAVFEGSQAVRVPRTRFVPVKKTDDLLTVRSDAYVLSADFEVIQNPERLFPPPVVELDPRFYKFVTDLDARFPDGPPSLLACKALKIVGDHLFKENVRCLGIVELKNETGQQITIPAESVVDGRYNDK